MKIQGFYTALVTPFDKKGELDVEGFRFLVRRQIEAGADGIVVNGTTGESPTLTEEELDIILQVSRAETKGKIQWIVGTGSYSTAKTIDLTRRAYDLGADAAMIITPYYNKPTQEGIYQHFRAISEAVDLPLIVYNHQGRTGTNITTPTLKRLATLKNVVAVKEASGNIQQIIEVLTEVKSDEFAVLSGDDCLTLAIMAMGGDGILSVVGNVVPQEMRALVDAMQRGDLPLARQIQRQLMPLFKASGLETNPIPVKAMMELQGLPAGPCRLPLTPMSEAHMAEVRELMVNEKAFV
jgi:4-hydroxy-tetrahydrodipicolinate synthase